MRLRRSDVLSSSSSTSSTSSPPLTMSEIICDARRALVASASVTPPGRSSRKASCSASRSGAGLRETVLRRTVGRSRCEDDCRRRARWTESACSITTLWCGEDDKLSSSSELSSCPAVVRIIGMLSDGLTRFETIADGCSRCDALRLSG